MEQGLNNLVKDLRDIEQTMFALGTSPINMDNVSIRLAYDKRWGPTANAAADAIEALQAKVERLTKENKELAADRPELEEVNGHWEWRKPNGEVLMPKLGEWELIDGAEPMRFGCSRCKYMSWETSNYCPRCGADMRKMEVQE